MLLAASAAVAWRGSFTLWNPAFGAKPDLDGSVPGRIDRASDDRSALL